MNAFAHFPSHLYWNAQQLADAVPLRLHEMFAFDATRDGRQHAAANVESRRAATVDYAARSVLPARFVVR